MAIITISRGAYSGIEALAERLREELGYRLLSREELLVNTAKEFVRNRHPALWRHLCEHIATGTQCGYYPSEPTANWTVSH